MLTSATLSTDGHFDYIKGRLGFEDARELLLGSPFDYKRSTLMLAPSDMPEPDQHGYLAALQTALIELVRASEGRALVLFTSHSGLARGVPGDQAAARRAARSSCSVRASMARRASCWRRCARTTARWSWARRASGRAST